MRYKLMYGLGCLNLLSALLPSNKFFSHFVPSLFQLMIIETISSIYFDAWFIGHNSAFKTNIYLFVLILYSPVNNFQSCEDVSSWVEPVLSRR